MSDAFHRLPPLNALRAFEAAARHLTFRQAADELGVTQGAVAQQVRGLETDLGVALFQRLPRRLALTDEGRAFLPNIRRAFELIQDASALLRPEPARLTISVTPSLATKWLIPCLPDFVADNPMVDLRIVATETLSSFQTDGVDIAIRQGRPPFGAGLIADLLFPQQLIAVCSPRLMAAGESEWPAEALQDHVLLHDTHNFWPDFFEQALSLKMRPEAKRMRFNQTGLAIDAAVAGQGVALASRILAAADLEAGRLVQPIRAEMRGIKDFYLLLPRRRRQPDPAEAVRRWLLQAGERFRG